VFLYFSPVVKDKNISLIPLLSLDLNTEFKNDIILKTDLVGSYNLYLVRSYEVCWGFPEVFFNFYYDTDLMCKNMKVK